MGGNSTQRKCIEVMRGPEYAGLYELCCRVEEGGGKTF